MALDLFFFLGIGIWWRRRRWSLNHRCRVS